MACSAHSHRSRPVVYRLLSSWVEVQRASCYTIDSIFYSIKSYFHNKVSKAERLFERNRDKLRRVRMRRNEQVFFPAPTSMFTRISGVINKAVRCRTPSLVHGKTWLIARNLPDTAAYSFPSRYPSLGCPFHLPGPPSPYLRIDHLPSVLLQRNTMTRPAVFRRPFIISRLISSTWVPLTRRLSSFCRTYAPHRNDYIRSACPRGNFAEGFRRLFPLRSFSSFRTWPINLVEWN